MRKIRELLRLKYELGCSHREIATSLGIANSTVSDYASQAGRGASLRPPEVASQNEPDRGDAVLSSRSSCPRHTSARRS